MYLRDLDHINLLIEELEHTYQLIGCCDQSLIRIVWLRVVLQYFLVIKRPNLITQLSVFSNPSFKVRPIQLVIYDIES